jgi:hypothetical protein
MSFINRRRVVLSGLVSGLMLGLAGCASAPARPTDMTRPVTLISAFEGKTTGAGHFRVWLTGDERRFTALLHGTVTTHQGRDRLTVVEDFLYDDGQKDRLTWVFDRIAPDRWEGTREDTVGIAQVVEKDGQITLTYTADFKSADAVTRLGFADLIYGLADGPIINDAVVTRSGVPVAAVQFVLTR